jgi:hypothetical protein
MTTALYGLRCHAWYSAARAWARSNVYGPSEEQREAARQLAEEVTGREVQDSEVEDRRARTFRAPGSPHLH